MDFVDIYNRVSNSAAFFGLLFLIAVALWLLAIQKIERPDKRGR